MPYVPPVVHSTLVGGPAYLLGWERLDVADGGGWAAKLAWAQVQDEGAWLVKSGVVPAGQVKQIPGQDYSRSTITTGITNAASEGVNRLIKTHARCAFGYRNPANQRLRARCATTPHARGHLA